MTSVVLRRNLTHLWRWTQCRYTPPQEMSSSTEPYRICEHYYNLYYTFPLKELALLACRQDDSNWKQLLESLAHRTSTHDKLSFKVNLCRKWNSCELPFLSQWAVLLWALAVKVEGLSSWPHFISVTNEAHPTLEGRISKCRIQQKVGATTWGLP